MLEMLAPLAYLLSYHNVFACTVNIYCLINNRTKYLPIRVGVLLFSHTAK